MAQQAGGEAGEYQLFDDRDGSIAMTHVAGGYSTIQGGSGRLQPVGDVKGITKIQKASKTALSLSTKAAVLIEFGYAYFVYLNLIQGLPETVHEAAELVGYDNVTVKKSNWAIVASALFFAVTNWVSDVSSVHPVRELTESIKKFELDRPPRKRKDNKAVVTLDDQIDASAKNLGAFNSLAFLPTFAVQAGADGLFMYPESREDGSVPSAGDKSIQAGLGSAFAAISFIGCVYYFMFSADQSRRLVEWWYGQGRKFDLSTASGIARFAESLLGAGLISSTRSIAAVAIFLQELVTVYRLDKEEDKEKIFWYLVGISVFGVYTNIWSRGIRYYNSFHPDIIHQLDKDMHGAVEHLFLAKPEKIAEILNKAQPDAQKVRTVAGKMLSKMVNYLITHKQAELAVLIGRPVPEGEVDLSRYKQTIRELFQGQPDDIVPLLAGFAAYEFRTMRDKDRRKVINYIRHSKAAELHDLMQTDRDLYYAELAEATDTYNAWNNLSAFVHGTLPFGVLTDRLSDHAWNNFFAFALRTLPLGLLAHRLSEEETGKWSYAVAAAASGVSHLAYVTALNARSLLNIAVKNFKKAREKQLPKVAFTTKGKSSYEIFEHLREAIIENNKSMGSAINFFNVISRTARILLMVAFLKQIQETFNIGLGDEVNRFLVAWLASLRDIVDGENFKAGMEEAWSTYITQYYISKAYKEQGKSFSYRTPFNELDPDIVEQAWKTYEQAHPKVEKPEDKSGPGPAVASDDAPISSSSTRWCPSWFGSASGERSPLLGSQARLSKTAPASTEGSPRSVSASSSSSSSSAHAPSAPPGDSRGMSREQAIADTQKEVGAALDARDIRQAAAAPSSGATLASLTDGDDLLVAAPPSPPDVPEPPLEPAVSKWEPRSSLCDRVTALFFGNRSKPSSVEVISETATATASLGQ